MVCSELGMLVVFFPGLPCDMTLVIASIGSEGMLVKEALQSCLPHQLDLRTGQLWADGQSTLQLHEQVRMSGRPRLQKDRWSYHQTVKS